MFLVIATSGPSSTYPQRAYRNPTDALVKFLDSKHGANWAIWEFRAEGTGYPDSEVYGRIRHYPWPDHHPPPFALIPNIMASMRDWLKGPDFKTGRVVVVHCKAGKGRSGTVACSYLISEENWTVNDALERFTARRMRSGFGAGVSIPSQLRWIGYVKRWTEHKKLYVERQIEVLEIHAWGLRDGVKVAVNGYVDEGRVIKTFHVFSKDERIIVDGTPITDTPNPQNEKPTTPNPRPFSTALIFRPQTRLVLPTSDLNLSFERRNKAPYGFTMVTSVAHVWFNTYFEGSGPEKNGSADPSGVFGIEWDAMDGIKGSARKGTKALDRLSVVWRAVDEEGRPGTKRIIEEPKEGQPVPETRAADWKGASHGNAAVQKTLGLKTESPHRQSHSKAGSIKSEKSREQDDDESVGVKPHGPSGEEHIPLPEDSGAPQHASVNGKGDGVVVDGITKRIQHVHTEDLPGGVPEGKMAPPRDHVVGQIVKEGEDLTPFSS